MRRYAVRCWGYVGPAGIRTTALTSMAATHELLLCEMPRRSTALVSLSIALWLPVAAW